MPNASKIIHLLAYGVYLAITEFVRFLPLKLVFWIGQRLGFVSSVILWRRRSVAEENIRIALHKSASESRRMACGHFMNLGGNLLSALKIATMSDEEIRRCVTVEIPPKLEELARRSEDKPGWIAMISHMGNWEILSHLSAFFPYYKYGAIYHRLANPQIDKHFKESRARSGITLFDRREGYLKCVNFIRSGGVIGVLVDQYAGLPGTWMPFFRRLTSTSTLAATLAQRASTEIVPISIKTVGLARWHVSIQLPIPGDSDAEIVTARINQELERQITGSPEDWLWSHNRWKTPRWVFLFSRAGRRTFLPQEFDRSTLIPYRILVRSADEPGEAKQSIPAMRAIKLGRCDVHLTVAVATGSKEIWENMAEVDEVLVIDATESVLKTAKRIKSLSKFDVAILFSAEWRAALELYLAGVPYRVGPPNRLFLNEWENPPGACEPSRSGAERYRTIAQAVGAAMD